MNKDILLDERNNLAISLLENGYIDTSYTEALDILNELLMEKK